MSAFHYRAVNVSGREQKGVIEAESERHARQLLRELHLLPLVVQTAQKKNKNIVYWFQRRAHYLTQKELAFLTRQFATLLKAGLPIEEALTAIAEQSEKSRVKGLILSVRARVMEGHALASALRDFPQAFPDWYSATV